MKIPSKNQPQLIDDHWCFACGMENKSGLCLDWKVEGKTTSAEFVPRKEHQGWKDIVHGGILAAILDEAMTRLAWIVCGGPMTAEMTVRYLKPAKVGEKLFIFGEITRENRKLVEMKAEIFKEESSPSTSPFPSMKRGVLTGSDPPRILADSEASTWCVKGGNKRILIARASGKAIKLK